MPGTAWPSLRETFDLPQSGLGMVLAATLGGFLASSVMAGRLVARLGVGMLLALSTGLVSLCMLGFAAAPTWPLFLASAAVLGVGSGAIDSGLNGYAARHFSARHMNWLHAAYGLGAALGPLAMTAVLAQGFEWRWGYLPLAAALAVMSALFVASRRSWKDDPMPSGGGKAGGATGVLRRPLAQLQIAIFFVYTGVEITAGQWCFALLSEGRGLSTAAAGLVAASFWAALFAGRVLTGVVVDRLGADGMVRVAMLGALVGAVALALAPTPVGVAGILLIGLAVAPIYPLLMSRTPARLGAADALHAVGFQVAAAMLGGVALPGLGGLLAERFGLEAIAVLTAVAALILWLMHELLLRLTAAARECAA